MSVSPILRPLGFGEVLDRAFTLYRRHFTTLVLAALIPTAVTMAVALALGILTDPSAAESPLVVVFILAMLASTTLMWGAITHLTSQAHGELSESAMGGLRVAATHFWRLLFAITLAFVAMMALFTAVTMVVGIVLAIVGTGVENVAGALMVFLVIIGIVGFMALVMLCSALFLSISPAVIVEGKGPLQALFRSIELARGAVLRLMLLSLVVFAIVYLPVIAVTILTGGLAVLTDPMAYTEPTGAAYAVQQLLTWGVGVLTTPFMVCAFVVQYYDRRVRTEGLDVQALADRLAAT